MCERKSKCLCECVRERWRHIEGSLVVVYSVLNNQSRIKELEKMNMSKKCLSYTILTMNLYIKYV